MFDLTLKMIISPEKKEFLVCIQYIQLGNITRYIIMKKYVTNLHLK